MKLFQSLAFSGNDLIRFRVLYHKLYLGSFITTISFKNHNKLTLTLLERTEF